MEQTNIDKIPEAEREKYRLYAQHIKNQTHCSEEIGAQVDDILETLIWLRFNIVDVVNDVEQQSINRFV